MKEFSKYADHIASMDPTQRAGAEIMKQTAKKLAKKGLLKPSLDEAIIKPSFEVEDPLLTASEAALVLRVNVNTVKRLGDRGSIDFYRIGKREDRRFSFNELKRYLDEHKQTSTHTPPAKK